MGKRLYPHNRVRYWYAYDLDDICTLFADRKLHVQTVRKWIKSELVTIDQGKPSLVYGHDLIKFLKTHNRANKKSTPFAAFYCMACQDARFPFRNQISVVQATQFLKIQAVCRCCKTRMFKNYKLGDWTLLKRQLKLVGVSELYDDAISTAKTQIHVEEEEPSNESLQGDLFL